MPFCSNCGAQHEASVHFCNNCGTALVGGAPSAPPAQSASAYPQQQQQQLGQQGRGMLQQAYGVQPAQANYGSGWAPLGAPAAPVAASYTQNTYVQAPPMQPSMAYVPAPMPMMGGPVIETVQRDAWTGREVDTFYNPMSGQETVVVEPGYRHHHHHGFMGLGVQW